MEKIEEQILTTCKKICQLVGFDAEVRVSSNKDQILVEVETDSAGLAIGSQGQNLKAFERILQVIFYQQLGKEKTIVVDVGGFRERRTKTLEELATKAIEAVLQTGQPKTLTGLSPAERKLIHLRVSTNPDLISESLGKGVGRALTITRKDRP